MASRKSRKRTLDVDVEESKAVKRRQVQDDGSEDVESEVEELETEMPITGPTDCPPGYEFRKPGFVPGMCIRNRKNTKYKVNEAHPCPENMHWRDGYERKAGCIKPREQKERKPRLPPRAAKRKCDMLTIQNLFANHFTVIQSYLRDLYRSPITKDVLSFPKLKKKVYKMFVKSLQKMSGQVDCDIEFTVEQKAQVETLIDQEIQSFNEAFVTESQWNNIQRNTRLDLMLYAANEIMDQYPAQTNFTDRYRDGARQLRENLIHLGNEGMLPHQNALVAKAVYEYEHLFGKVNVKTLEKYLKRVPYSIMEQNKYLLQLHCVHEGFVTTTVPELNVEPVEPLPAFEIPTITEFTETVKYLMPEAEVQELFQLKKVFSKQNMTTNISRLTEDGLDLLQHFQTLASNFVTAKTVGKQVLDEQLLSQNYPALTVAQVEAKYGIQLFKRDRQEDAAGFVYSTAEDVLPDSVLQEIADLRTLTNLYDDIRLERELLNSKGVMLNERGLDLKNRLQALTKAIEKDWPGRNQKMEQRIERFPKLSLDQLVVRYNGPFWEEITFPARELNTLFDLHHFRQQTQSITNFNARGEELIHMYYDLVTRFSGKTPRQKELFFQSYKTPLTWNQFEGKYGGPFWNEFNFFTEEQLDLFFDLFTIRQIGRTIPNMKYNARGEELMNEFVNLGIVFNESTTSKQRNNFINTFKVPLTLEQLIEKYHGPFWTLPLTEEEIYEMLELTALFKSFTTAMLKGNRQDIQLNNRGRELQTRFEELRRKFRTQYPTIEEQQQATQHMDKKFVIEDLKRKYGVFYEKI